MSYKTTIAELQRRLDAALAELEQARLKRLRPEAVKRLELMAQECEARLVRAIERHRHEDREDGRGGRSRRSFVL